MRGKVRASTPISAGDKQQPVSRGVVFTVNQVVEVHRRSCRAGGAHIIHINEQLFGAEIPELPTLLRVSVRQSVCVRACTQPDACTHTCTHACVRAHTQADGA